MYVQLPPDLRIVTPGPTVPKEMAEFAEKWSGVWDNILDHILIVCANGFTLKGLSCAA